MDQTKRAELVHSTKVANMCMGVGMLLTIVPTGLALVSIVISGDDTFWNRLISLGWAFFVTALLLPIGMALLFFGFGKMAALKRALKQLDEKDDE